DKAAMGPPADVYSLGVMLYELLTGRRPFQDTGGNIYYHIANTDPPSLSALRPGIDPGLEVICRKAMAKRIPERYRSMAEFAASLESYLEASADGSPSAPGGRGPSSDPGAGGKTPPRRRLGLAAAVAASLVFLGLLGVVIYIATDKGTVKIEGADPAMVV